jgi:2-polyprenyl-3-methyl-5-hydroxy-6-metoxy-1,4-benzoquinol methylase
MSVSENIKDLYVKKKGYGAGSRPEMHPFIPQNAKKILDVGCSEGEFGKCLKDDSDRIVWGVDINPTSVAEAKGKLDKALCGDVFDLVPELPNNYFDAIFFNDVLEHLVDPYALLRQMGPKLSSNGVVIASIPNILYFRTLKALLVDKDWKYEDYGVLDNTHLRFFTKKSMKRMFEENGYEIIDIVPINKTKSLKPFFMNLLSFGILGDQIKYINFVVTAAPKKPFSPIQSSIYK